MSRTGSPDATFVGFDGDSESEDGIAFGDYGYASDSDLEDKDEAKASQMPPSDVTAVLESK